MPIVWPFVEIRALRAAPIAALAVSLGCSPSASSDPPVDQIAAAPAGSAGETAAEAPLALNPSPASDAVNAPSVPPPGPSADGCEATRSEATSISEPVDIIVILDNSLSMVDEAQAVETNLNDNFASILRDAAIDYRVILISEHRSRSLRSTAVCIASPLSGLAQCPGSEPVFTDRFFHFSTEIGSNDSFDVLLETYSGGQRDDFDLAPLGWSDWLREGAKKVFLEISDDDADRSVASFSSALTALAPEHFGSDPQRPNLVWHSIVGIAEKENPVEAYQPEEAVQRAECSGNQNNVFNAGLSYQDLSRQTGGLRFPICQFDAYDTVFNAIADSVIKTSTIECAFSLPLPPSSQRLELDKVAVSYTPGDGSPSRVFGQVLDAKDCQVDAFFVNDGGVALCPQACDTVRADTTASVDVLFTCASTLIVR